MHQQPPDTPQPPAGAGPPPGQQPPPAPRRFGPGLAATALALLIAIAAGLGIGYLLFHDDQETKDADRAAETVAEGNAGAGTAVTVIENQQLIDAAERAQIAAGAATGEVAATEDAATLAAQLAYLRGVADLQLAARQVNLAAKAKAERQRRRYLKRASAYAQAAALGAAVRRRQVKNAVLRARLAAVKARADAISARVDSAAAKGEAAARREVSRLNRSLAQTQRRIEQELRRALQAGGRELNEALREIESELNQPIEQPGGEGAPAAGQSEGAG